MFKLCKKGFTLIELMIVIAIVAIFIAFITPFLSQSVSNLKRSQVEETIENKDQLKLDEKDSEDKTL